MRLPLLVALWLVLIAPVAQAGDPIMPLDQVERGMQCEGRSVFRGTTVETFGVEILDVISSSPTGDTAILFRAFGPQVAETGIGPGFSGSPIYCRDGEGTLRSAGAIAAGVEDYGNDVALATPIEAVLGTPAPAPPEARAATAAERRASPWGLPLTVAGPSAFIRRALAPAARRSGIDLLMAPATAAQAPAPVDLVPGSAVGTSLSNGHVGLSAIGTVAYRDEDRVWAFGHPLDNAGRRALLLETAFVHHVIGNPHPAGESSGTYKLASPGQVVGGVGFDGPYAVTGRLGAQPTTTVVEVEAEANGEPAPVSRTIAADESPLNFPAGFGTLSLVAPIAVADTAFTSLGSGTGRSHGAMCLRIELAGRERPLGFCNRYVGDGHGPGGPQVAMAGDTALATALIEDYDRSQLEVERVGAEMVIDEGMRFAVIRSASAPRVVRPGQRIRVRLVVQPPREETRRVSFRVRVPRSIRPGVRTLRLTGTDADPADASLLEIFGFALRAQPSMHEDLIERAGDPNRVDQLAAAVASIARFDGIRASFKRPRDEEIDELALLLGLIDESDSSAGTPVYRHPRLRIGGEARIRLRVRRR